jgi:hypothetical protein
MFQNIHVIFIQALLNITASWQSNVIHININSDILIEQNKVSLAEKYHIYSNKRRPCI